MTVSVHPVTTSHSTSIDTHLTALRALDYLSALSKSVGPRNARFLDTLIFKRSRVEAIALGPHGDRKPYMRTPKSEPQPTSQSPSSPEAEDVSNMSDLPDPDACINNSLAHKSSLFVVAEGFWSTVGWAFNTSIRYPIRWQYWKKWLTLTLEILEAELPTPSRTAATIIRGLTNDAANPILIQSSSPSAAGSSNAATSLASVYLAENDLTYRTGLRKVLRAIFVDGGQPSLTEFHEVWTGETKPLKSQNGVKIETKRKKVDLDQGEFGDYWDDEFDDEMPSETGALTSQDSSAKAQRTSGRTSRKRGEYYVVMNLDHGLTRQDENENDSRTPRKGTNVIDEYGGIDSLLLRIKILAWLANAFLNQQNGVNLLRSLLDQASEFIRALPLPVFQIFIASTAYVDDFADITLAKLYASLLHDLSSATHVPYFQYVMPTQEALQQWYLPLSPASSSVVDVARVSLLVEALTRLIWKKGFLKPNVGLRGALETGISARVKSIKAALKKARGKAESEALMTVTEQVHTKLTMIVDVVESSA